MSEEAQIKRLRKKLIGHGALLVFIGGILGFGFLFFLIGKITLWPIPWEVDYQMPGTYDAWRMAHMEGIVNGLLLWLTASILPLLPFGVKGMKRTAYGMMLITWSIVLAATIDPFFAESRGLTFGGSLTNQLAFFLFYIGVPGTMIAMGAIAWHTLKPETAQEPEKVGKPEKNEAD